MGQPRTSPHGVLYLASEESAFVTGTVLQVNGGSPYSGRSASAMRRSAARSATRRASRPCAGRRSRTCCGSRCGTSAGIAGARRDVLPARRRGKRAARPGRRPVPRAARRGHHAGLDDSLFLRQLLRVRRRGNAGPVRPGHGACGTRSARQPGCPSTSCWAAPAGTWSRPTTLASTPARTVTGTWRSMTRPLWQQTC